MNVRIIIFFTFFLKLIVSSGSSSKCNDGLITSVSVMVFTAKHYYSGTDHLPKACLCWNEECDCHPLPNEHNNDELERNDGDWFIMHAWNGNEICKLSQFRWETTGSDGWYMHRTFVVVTTEDNRSYVPFIAELVNACLLDKTSRRSLSRASNHQVTTACADGAKTQTELRIPVQKNFNAPINPKEQMVGDIFLFLKTSKDTGGKPTMNNLYLEFNTGSGEQERSHKVPFGTKDNWAPECKNHGYGHGRTEYQGMCEAAANDPEGWCFGKDTRSISSKSDIRKHCPVSCGMCGYTAGNEFTRYKTDVFKFRDPVTNLKIKDIKKIRLIYGLNNVNNWKISSMSVLIKPMIKTKNGPEFYVPVDDINGGYNWFVEKGTDWSVLDMPIMFGWLNQRCSKPKKGSKVMVSYISGEGKEETLGPKQHTAVLAQYPGTLEISFAQERAKTTFNTLEQGWDVNVMLGLEVDAKFAKITREISAGYHRTWESGNELSTTYSTEVTHTCAAYDRNYERACVYEWQPKTYKLTVEYKFQDQEGNQCGPIPGVASVVENTNLRYNVYNRYHCPHPTTDNNLCKKWKAAGKCDEVTVALQTILDECPRTCGTCDNGTRAYHWLDGPLQNVIKDQNINDMLDVLTGEGGEGEETQVGNKQSYSEGAENSLKIVGETGPGKVTELEVLLLEKLGTTSNQGFLIAAGMFILGLGIVFVLTKQCGTKETPELYETLATSLEEI